MKAWSLAVLGAAWSVAALGQGMVNFCNVNSGTGLDAPIFRGDGVTKLSGPEFTAELLAGTSAVSLSVVAQTRFLTGDGAGYFQGGVVSLPMVAPGESAFLQVRVFSTSYGSFPAAQTVLLNDVWGMSSIFKIATGGAGIPPSPPAALTGLNGFSLAIIPEPSALSLAGAGTALLLALRRRSDG